MAYNPNEKRDATGKWTKGGLVSSDVAKKIASNEAEEQLIGRSLDIEELMKMAKESAPEVDAEAKRVAKIFDATVTPINLKSKESLVRKIRDELGNDVTQVKDSVRNTIVVNDKSDIEKVLSAFDNPGNKIKRQLPEKFLGYSGNIVNFKTKNGLTAEIQVNTPHMIVAKEAPADAIRILGENRYNEIAKRFPVQPGGGHKYYEQFREITPAKLQETPALKFVAEDIDRQSKAYYDAVRKVFE